MTLPASASGSSDRFANWSRSKSMLMLTSFLYWGLGGGWWQCWWWFCCGWEGRSWSRWEERDTYQERNTDTKVHTWTHIGKVCNRLCSTTDMCFFLIIAHILSRSSKVESQLYKHLGYLCSQDSIWVNHICFENQNSPRCIKAIQFEMVSEKTIASLFLIRYQNVTSDRIKDFCAFCANFQQKDRQNGSLSAWLIY